MTVTIRGRSAGFSSALKWATAPLLAGAVVAAGVVGGHASASSSLAGANVRGTGLSGALTLSPGHLPQASVGEHYSQLLTATGGVAPYTFSIVSGSPPSGISLSSGGLLSGTPPTLGTSGFTVQATDSSSPTALTGQHHYSLVVGLLISPPALPAAPTNASYTATLSASGGTGPYTFAVTSGTLPVGLTLSSSGVLSGAATQSGTKKFTITATDSSVPANKGLRQYSFVVGVLGQWSLFTVSNTGGGTNRDGVTLHKGGTMSDSDGNTGTYHYVSSTTALTMNNFVFRNYTGTWDGLNQQFSGTYTGPDNGNFTLTWVAP
jgi:hypothetical protein